MKNKHPSWMKLNKRGCRPLTLQELILKSDFHAMMEYITAFDKKMVGLERHFYRAIEAIRKMKVKYNPEYILAKYEYGGPFVIILEGKAWHEWINSPVRRAKDLHCTDTQLAAQCLWHLTFYGFTPKEQKENARKYMEEVEERQERNDEVFLADDLYSDDYIRECALSGKYRVRDEVLERLFTPEEIVEIKKCRKERLDVENAERDAAEEEERKQLEQEAALKLELRKKAEEEKRKEWYRKRRRSRQRNKHK